MAGADPGGTPIVLVVPGPSPSLVPQPAMPGIVVVQPRPHLPFTGFDVPTAAVLAALLLALGILLLVTTHGRLTTT